MNLADVAALPVVVDVRTAAQVLGISQDAAYDLIAAGRWPTPVLRLGKLIRIPTAPLRALVALEHQPSVAAN
jgi:excisionase family DNA binding protein